MGEELERIRERKREWEEGPRQEALNRFPYLQPDTNKFYTPLDVEGFDFLEEVGFPGTYPFTSGTFPVEPLAGMVKFAAMAGQGSLPGAAGQTRAATYSGYGTPENTRDYYKDMLARGLRGGPNLAFDLPTQCGYDSDDPLVEGEVGKVGVCVDTLRDLEIIYEPYQGDLNLDRIASNFTINAPANIIIAMYLALAEKRGVPFDKLRGTPQNDILKEYIARGTYIFPPREAMRLFRDSLVFIAENIPGMNITSMGGYHIREAGATREQDLAFSMAIAIAYLQSGIDAGLQVDEFAPQFTFNAFGGSMEILKEIALQRAARRMYARILKERFGAKDPRSMRIRQAIGAHIGPSSTTLQRPLNNLSRAVLGAVASVLSGNTPIPFPPYDEPLGLGWSLEALQLSTDAGRIISCETKMLEYSDPFAGSYCMESLTDEIEQAAGEELEKIEKMGGAVAAVENGYMQREITRSAYEKYMSIQKGERLVVGLNCFTGESELDVRTTMLVPNPYDPDKRERAEEEQKRKLAEVKKNRDGREVSRLLGELEKKAGKEDENLIPLLIECAKAYVTEGETCEVLKGVFGVYENPSLI
jgi:methylmalonyl-CoA mutase N-terminal domain/subunit